MKACQIANFILIKGCLLISMLAATSLWGQGVAFNSADQYQPQAVVRCQFKSIIYQDSLWIYARLTFAQPIPDSLWVRCLVNREEGEQEVTELNLSQAWLPPDNGSAVFKWSYGLSNAPSQLVLEVNLHPRVWTFHEEIFEDSFHPNGGVILYEPHREVPVIDHYLLAGDSLRVICKEPVDSLFAYHYSHVFDPARAPMILQPSVSDNTLNITDILKIPAATRIAFNNPGLYFLQRDTTGIEGTSIFVGSEYFPKPVKVSDLSEPLVYITTKKEYQEIAPNLQSKKALDKFWLSTVGSPQKARSTIKNYYQFVESANMLFTSYKEGWKTDRGMIYTIMGPPLVVTRYRNHEEWKYRNRADMEIVFTFLKVSNIFSNNHYELLREKSLDRPWFLAIDRWRKGLTGF